DAVVETGIANLLEIDRVSLAQYVERVTSDGAEHANREAGTREWMPANHRLRQSELAADITHLVLEQLAQWLDEREAHSWLEPTDVVMRLDGDGRAAAR